MPGVSFCVKNRMPNDAAPVPIPTPKRVDRFAVCLPCQLVATNARFHGTVVNLSWGGLCIEFADDLSEIELGTLQFVTVDSIGTLRVDGRWSRSRRIGVMFADQNAAREQIQSFMVSQT